MKIPWEKIDPLYKPAKEVEESHYKLMVAAHDLYKFLGEELLDSPSLASSLDEEEQRLEDLRQSSRGVRNACLASFFLFVPLLLLCLALGTGTLVIGEPVIGVVFFLIALIPVYPIVRSSITVRQYRKYIKDYDLLSGRLKEIGEKSRKGEG